MHLDDELRAYLIRLLDWREAHVNLEIALKGFPPELRGKTPSGAPHSAWQLLEHLRIAQHDILDFCVNPAYKEMHWPDDYWPAPAPPTPTAWDEAIEAYDKDLIALRNLVRHQADLLVTIPHGNGQTYLREILLVADHNAYHVGQIVLVRHLLGIWPAA
jgi:uncharacterized damage-inducible protein DinB